jgi:uncharacterized membrane protein YdjX (TVP38/TMEM64 family)
MIENITEKITDFVSKAKRNPEAARRIFVVIGIYGIIYILIGIVLSLFEISREDIKAYFDQFGLFTSVIFFLAVLLIAMTPLPDAPLIAAGILLLGIPLGFIIIWMSMLAASMINFWISKRFGRNFVVANYPETIRLVDIFTKDNGIETIVVARMFTFVSFDMVSYAAGLTSMKYSHFFIASLISMLPIAVMYTFIGAGIAAQDIYSMIFAFSISVSISIGLGFLVRSWRRRHPEVDSLQSNQESNQNNK